MAGMPRLNDLSADEYLNAPMTRLEYLLMGLESLVSSRSEEIREYEPPWIAPHNISDTVLSLKEKRNDRRIFVPPCSRCLR
jgi:hypothetical protein